MIAGARLWLAAILCLLPMLGVNAQSLEVIALKHRSAQEVIPVLQPLLDPVQRSAVRTTQLFVRTSAANLAQIRAASRPSIARPDSLCVGAAGNGRK